MYFLVQYNNEEYRYIEQHININYKYFLFNRQKDDYFLQKNVYFLLFFVDICQLLTYNNKCNSI